MGRDPCGRHCWTPCRLKNSGCGAIAFRCSGGSQESHREVAQQLLDGNYPFIFFFASCDLFVRENIDPASWRGGAQANLRVCPKALFLREAGRTLKPSQTPWHYCYRPLTPVPPNKRRDVVPP